MYGFEIGEVGLSEEVRTMLLIDPGFIHVIASALTRHRNEDWGDVDEYQAVHNWETIDAGIRCEYPEEYEPEEIHSLYPYEGGYIWISTDAYRENTIIRLIGRTDVMIGT